jgi:hypothetical protein
MKMLGYKQKPSLIELEECFFSCSTTSEPVALPKSMMELLIMHISTLPHNLKVHA